MFPESHFPSSKWADNPNPRLKYDNTNRREMCDSKPRISYPDPITELPDKNQCQAKNYERDEHHMAEKKRIGG